MQGREFAQIAVRALALYFGFTGIFLLVANIPALLLHIQTLQPDQTWPHYLFSIIQPWMALTATIIGATLWLWAPWFGARLARTAHDDTAAAASPDVNAVSRTLLAIAGLTLVALGLQELVGLCAQELALGHQMAQNPDLYGKHDQWGLSNPSFLGALAGAFAKVVVGALFVMRVRVLLAFIRNYGRQKGSEEPQDQAPDREQADQP